MIWWKLLCLGILDLWPPQSSVFISSTWIWNGYTIPGLLSVPTTNVPHSSVFVLGCKLVGEKKEQTPKNKISFREYCLIFGWSWGRHCSKITSAEAKHCWGSTASDGFARKLSSSPLLGLQPACHTPCLSERVGGRVPRVVPAASLATCMQQYAGTFSSFSYSFWWNMQKFVCLRPLAFCQIGWNCSTGSKCAWGKIANWQMARKHNHICLISWRTRLKIHHYNRLQEGRQRVTGKQ